jgi:hypothetical protein
MNKLKVYYLESKLEGRDIYSNMVVIAKNKKDAIGLSKLESQFYITKEYYEKHYEESFSNDYNKVEWRDCYQSKFDQNQNWIENPLTICISEDTILEKEIVLSSEFLAI